MPRGKVQGGADKAAYRIASCRPGVSAVNVLFRQWCCQVLLNARAAAVATACVSFTIGPGECAKGIYVHWHRSLAALRFCALRHLAGAWGHSIQHLEPWRHLHTCLPRVSRQFGGFPSLAVSLLAEQICLFKDCSHSAPDLDSCPLLLAVHPHFDWTVSAYLSERSLCLSQIRAPIGRAAEAWGCVGALTDTSCGLLGHVFQVPVVCLRGRKLSGAV